MAKTYHADYMSEINDAVGRGDYAAAAKLEQERNEKIVNTGSKQQQTNLYSQYLNSGSSASGTGSKNSGVSSSSGALGSAAGVLDRAVGVGGKGTQNLGAYKDANGNTTTYRPEFAGQTVQIGKQYVTYNERGYPTKSVSVSHAQNLGNAYTSQNMGLDQTKISNAADIYKAIYNATMQNGAALSGNAQDNAYGKQNIQYSGGMSVEDYDEAIRQASAKGSNVLAGFLEDSRNALLQSLGRANEQTSTYNGGWNYVDNGGGIGNIYKGALADPAQTNQALGGGWYAGLGKGDPAEEYFYRNTDAPTMQEVLNYAAALGYDIFDETQTIPVGDLARQMMANGYVSPERLQAAETLKITVPAALKNLGIESDSTGTETLDAAIERMQSSGSGTVAETLKNMNGQDDVGKLYIQALTKPSGSGAAGNGYSDLYKQYASGSMGGSSMGAYTGSNDYESELLKLYGEGGAYDQAQDQLKAMIDAQTKQAISGYETQKGAVNQSYDDVARQLYIDRENAKKNLAQQLAASGLTGGASESTMLGLNTNYQENVRQVEQERINTLSDLEQAIVQAQLTGDITYAERALALAQQQAESYGNVLQLLMNRQDAAKQQAYDRQMAAYNQQLAAQDAAFNRQMMQAELLASAGDFSGYKALGLTDAEIATLNSNYQKQNAPKVSSGGGGGYTKPTLTFNQAKELLEDGVVNDRTLYAYEYYAGQPWQSTADPLEELVGDLDALAGSKDVSRADLRDVINGAYNQGSITAAEKTKLIDYYCR
ncbi:MAG: hypothetical protein IKC24_08875 [Oscillospiraceae bacterium]|nr:hypothetical protein [Oscillospiraceae bacterium]